MRWFDVVLDMSPGPKVGGIGISISRRFAFLKGHIAQKVGIRFRFIISSLTRQFVAASSLFVIGIG